jgi:5-methyltetrahydrofolate--homocysteine methyltransferase
MAETIRRMARVAAVPLTAQPSAGLPEHPNGQTIYPCPPEEMAALAAEMVHNGVRIVGGCCGTTPDHIRAIRERITAVPASTSAKGTPEKNR